MYIYIWMTLTGVALQCISYCIHYYPIQGVFGNSPKNISVEKQHEDVDQVIAHKSTLNSL